MNERANERANERVIERVIELRTCGDCYRCCVDLGVADRPAGVRCPDLSFLAGPGMHCRRYDDRPDACREYQCFWRIVEPAVLPGRFRPDFCGAVFSGRLASDLGVPPNPGGDWMIVVAEPAYHFTLPGVICTNRVAMEAVWRLRMAGCAVMIDDRATGGRAPIDMPLRLPTHQFAHHLADTLERLRNEHQRGRQAGEGTPT